MDEALTNVITHGTKNDSLSFINIEFLRENNKISVIIEDSGKYFDITKVNPPPPIKMIRKGKTHGFGIYLIKSLMDEVYYTYSKEEGINKLVLVKYI
jgi:anti-sigma regulatory factor (Ser/Thr protein kinase)